MNLPKSIVITGATGFVGRALVEKLQGNSGCKLTLLVRKKVDCFLSDVDQVVVPSKKPFQRPLSISKGATVIHLAGRAHILDEKSERPLHEFRLVNVEATIDLARQAMEAGARRFIFISSIGVNGSVTYSAPFNEDAAPQPHADYAVSKLEAECALRTLVEKGSMELVVIRPPLVYAANAPGNYQRLMRLVSKGLPLPFGAIKNLRNLISLENLVDFICLCIEHPAAANELFLVSDINPVSTSEMITALAQGMGLKPRLVSVPDFLLRTGARIFRKQSIYAQLCGSLVIDSSKARNLLGWTPPISVIDALHQSGRKYIMQKSEVSKHGRVL
ncbi:NAD-dependent epimerase/dehydratase family protein [Pseudomonas corrugata]|uniref:NAD-dependent epimerase/dehydratase family protein n=1 Tax=Pseudomonas corrugata TaxID=47879 RepID=UPI0028C4B7BA|nr:NAD-dependent epimerase/dehydratase family protein [Pseudomonas corrugata]MDU9033940.1 NAD-dependent epimerase/dehydratase family protein [Pseudomonas corrugata]